MNLKKLLLFLALPIIQLQAQIPEQEQPNIYEQAPITTLDFVTPTFSANSVLTARCFSQDAKLMAFGNSNGTVIVDDPQNNASYELSPRIRGVICHLAFSQNDEYLLAYSQTNVLARINDSDEQDEQEPVARSLANIIIWKRTYDNIYEQYSAYATHEDTTILQAKIADNGTAVFYTQEGLFVLKKGQTEYPELTQIPDTAGKNIVPFTLEAKPRSHDVSVWYVCNDFIRRGVLAQTSASRTLPHVRDDNTATITLNLFENNRRQLIPFNNINNRNNTAISEIEKIGGSIFLRSEDSSLRIITHDNTMRIIQLPANFQTISLMQPSEDKQLLLVVAQQKNQDWLQDDNDQTEKIILCYNTQGTLVWSIKIPPYANVSALEYKTSFQDFYIALEIANKFDPDEGIKTGFFMISQDPRPLPLMLRERAIHEFTQIFSPLCGNYYLHVDQTQDETKKVFVGFYITKESNR